VVSLILNPIVRVLSLKELFSSLALLPHRDAVMMIELQSPRHHHAIASMI
jgi:hypothetical protein